MSRLSKVAASNIKRFVEKGTVPRSGIKIADAWQTYRSKPDIGKRTPRTLYEKECTWNAFVSWLSANRPDAEWMRDISREAAASYMESVRTRVGSKSYANIRTGLRSIIQLLRIDGELSENVFDVVPSAAVSMTSWRHFTGVEYKRILKAAKGEWHLACMVGYYTGLRFADVALLERKQIDLETGVITLVPRKMARYSNALRIPIHPTLLKALRPVCRKKGFIMPELANGYDARSKDVTRHFAKILKAAKVKDNVSFHSFRHTFNTNMQAMGVEVKTRQKLTGHSTPEMNQVYSHDIEILRKAIEKLA